MWKVLGAGGELWLGGGERFGVVLPVPTGQNFGTVPGGSGGRPWGSEVGDVGWKRLSVESDGRQWWRGWSVPVVGAGNVGPGRTDRPAPDSLAPASGFKHTTHHSKVSLYLPLLQCIQVHALPTI